MSNGDTLERVTQAVRRNGKLRSTLAGVARAARSVGNSVLDIVLPPLCVSCGTRMIVHNTLCPDCWKGVDFIRAPLCDRLGIPLPYDTGGTMVSAAAISAPPDFDRARAVARYDGPIRRMIHAFKFNDTLHSRRLFARWLHEAGHELLGSCDIIIAVPLARRRLIWRRYNQSQILADEVARLAGKPVFWRALERTRATRSQVGLSRTERKRNVTGAFRVPYAMQTRIAGKAVLLVDDVVTTGATVNAAARALKKAGAVRVDVLAICLAGDVPHDP